MRILNGIRVSRQKFKCAERVKPSRSNPFATYGTTWNKMRKRFLAKNPICEFCKKAGIITPAEVVDHKIPHRGDSKLFWDVDNWQALCKRCHDSTKQKMEKSGQVVDF